MSLLLNVIWLLCGGLLVFFGWLCGGIALCLTIVGLPFGFQCLKIAVLALLPFGSSSVSRDVSPPTGVLYIFLNIIWLLFGGLWAVLGHALFGVLLCFTIIGIPFGLQHLKLMRLAATPFGRDIVDKGSVRYARA